MCTVFALKCRAGAAKAYFVWYTCTETWSCQYATWCAALVRKARDIRAQAATLHFLWHTCAEKLRHSALSCQIVLGLRLSCYVAIVQAALAAWKIISESGLAGFGCVGDIVISDRSANRPTTPALAPVFERSWLVELSLGVQE